jgi:small redox-active disulfide protein 2
MDIKILGPGCMNCKTLNNRTLEAVQQLGITATVEKVEDLQAIASYGIMRTPGLVIDDQVVSYGRVPAVEEIKDIILRQSATA